MFLPLDFIICFVMGHIPRVLLYNLSPDKCEEGIAFVKRVVKQLLETQQQRHGVGLLAGYSVYRPHLARVPVVVGVQESGERTEGPRNGLRGGGGEGELVAQALEGPTGQAIS